MGKLAEILKDLERGKISADRAEGEILRLFGGSLPADIRDEMDGDMEDGGMAQGEIESCLNHWSNKYVVRRREEDVIDRQARHFIGVFGDKASTVVARERERDGSHPQEDLLERVEELLDFRLGSPVRLKTNRHSTGVIVGASKRGCSYRVVAWADGDVSQPHVDDLEPDDEQ
jgi:hypothetical protein